MERKDKKRPLTEHWPVDGTVTAFVPVPVTVRHGIRRSGNVL